MTNFFDKKLASEIGYGPATEIAGVASQLDVDLAAMAALRKAQGRPTFEEEEAQSRAEFLEMMKAGERFDPDVEAWARGD